MALVRELLRWPALALDHQDQEGRSAWHSALRTAEGRPRAALLLSAGATMAIDGEEKQKIKEDILPILRAFGQRFKNPFEEGGILRTSSTARRLTACSGRLVKDAD